MLVGIEKAGGKTTDLLLECVGCLVCRLGRFTHPVLNEAHNGTR